MSAQRSSKRRKLNGTDDDLGNASTEDTAPAKRTSRLSVGQKSTSVTPRSARGKTNARIEPVDDTVIVNPSRAATKKKMNGDAALVEGNSAINGPDAMEDTLLPVRSSGRQKRTPRRFSDDMLNIDTIRIAEISPQHIRRSLGPSLSLEGTDSSKTERRTSGKGPSLKPTQAKVRMENKVTTPVKHGRNRKHDVNAEGSEASGPSDQQLDEVSLPPTPSSSRKAKNSRVIRKRVRKSTNASPAEPIIMPMDVDEIATQADANKTSSVHDDVDVSMASPDIEPLIETALLAVHNSLSNGNSIRPAKMTSVADLPRLNCAIGDDQMKNVKNVLMQRAIGRQRIPLCGLDDEYHKVQQLVEQTVLAGEGNSMLVIGPRGSGKTAMVENIVTELSKTNPDLFHVIRLNGFIHTDDRIALRDIWRQLGKEMALEDEIGERNYADSLSTLLALLSHPDELQERKTEEGSKAVIFILDEFDQFTYHPRQTLLYNLFDIAQSRKAPIAVLGLTTRIDVTESLEKRVKSRFSHRYVYLPLARDFSAFQNTCKMALQIQNGEILFDEAVVVSRKTAKVKGRLKTIPQEAVPEQEIIESWNAYIEELFQNELLIHHLKRVFYWSKSIPEALRSFTTMLSELSSTKPFLEPEALLGDSSLQPPDSKLHMLRSLSNLAIVLLTAAARLDVILDTDVCNFNMAYEEYCTLAGKARLAANAAGMTRTGASGKIWSKDVAKGEWERLLDIGILVPAIGLGAATDMVTCDVALEEIEGAIPGLESWIVKWCREI